MSPPVSEAVEAGILMKVVNGKISQREAMKKLKIARGTLLIKLEKFRSEHKEECSPKILVKWEDLDFAKRDDISRRYHSGEITSSKAASELGVNPRTFRHRVSMVKKESAEVDILGERENLAGTTSTDVTCQFSVVEGTKGGEELQTLGDVDRHRPVETTLTLRHIQERKGLRATLHSERVIVTPLASTASIDLELSDRVSSPMFSPASLLAVGDSPDVGCMDMTPMGPVIGNELQSSVGVSSAVFSPSSASWIGDHRVCSGVVSDDSAIHDRTSTCFAIPRRRAAKKRLVLLTTPNLDVAEKQLTALNSDGASASDQVVSPLKRSRCTQSSRHVASSDSALENSTSFIEDTHQKRICLPLSHGYTTSSDSAFNDSTPFKGGSFKKRKRFHDVDHDCATTSTSALDPLSTPLKEPSIASTKYVTSGEIKAKNQRYKCLHAAELKKRKKLAVVGRSSVQKQKKANYIRNHPSAKKRQMAAYHLRHSSEKKRSKKLFKEHHPSAKKHARARRLFFHPSRYRVARHRRLRPELQCRRESLRQILYRNTHNMVIKAASEDQLQKALILAIHQRSSRKRKWTQHGENLTVSHLRSELMRSKLIRNEKDRHKILMCHVRSFQKRNTIFPKKGCVIKGSAEWIRRKEWFQKNWSVEAFTKDLLKRDRKKNILSAKREVALTLKRIKVEREEVIRSLYHQVHLIQKRYKEAETLRCLPDYAHLFEDERDMLLMHQYLGDGADRIHVLSQEPPTADVSMFEWLPVEQLKKPESPLCIEVTIDGSFQDDNSTSENNTECFTSVSDNVESVDGTSCVAKSAVLADAAESIGLNQTGKNSECVAGMPTEKKVQEASPTLARRCKCHLPPYFASIVHNALKGCDPTLSLVELQTYFIMLEHCDECDDLEYPSCPLEVCCDFLKFLQQHFSPHGTKGRTLLRHFYYCRQLNDWLMRLDAAVWDSDYELLCSLIPKGHSNSSPDAALVDVSANMLSEAWLNRKYEKQFNAFKSDIDRFIKEVKQVCDICKQRGVTKCHQFKCWGDFKRQPKCNNETLKKIKQFYLSKNAIEGTNSESSDSDEEQLVLPSNKEKLTVCTTCFTSIKQNKIPQKAEINGFYYKKFPEQLKLNFYEKLLIQRSRCFQTIIQLKPYTSMMHGTFVQALKGLVIHLPLNTDTTVNYALQQLPSFDLLQILVHSLPTSQKVVWKNLVDLKKVTAALNYLRKNNKEYKDVVVMQYRDAPVENQSVVFIPKPSEHISPQNFSGNDCLKSATPKTASSVVETDYESEAAIQIPLSGSEKESMLYAVDKGGDIKKNQAGTQIISANSMKGKTLLAVDRGSVRRNQAGTLTTSGNSEKEKTLSATDTSSSPTVSENQAGSEKEEMLYAADKGGGINENQAGSQRILADSDRKKLLSATGTDGSLSISENQAGSQKEKVSVEELVKVDAELAVTSNLEYIINADEIEAQYTVMSVQNPISKLTDVELFQQKRITGPVIPISDKKIDLHAFPHLLPDGKNGMYEEREVKVGPSIFPKVVLNMEDPRFRRDVAYLFFLYHALEHRALDHGIFACLHAKLSKDLTADQFRSMLSEEQSKVLEANLSMMFTQKRGSKEYWTRVGGDLHAIDMEKGPAHLFVTLSCAEYQWEDMYDYLVAANEDIPGFANMQQARMCVSDPVSVAKFFYARFKSFFEKVIMDKFGPLGEVLHHFWRIEYQARGAPHIHMKLWIKDAPLIGKDSAEAIEQYICNTITCHIPDVKTSPNLFNLVNKFQRHKCTKSCKRVKKIKNYGHITRCRYSFPRRVTNTFQFHTTKETVQSRERGKRIERLYDLPRSDKERMINDYNSALLLQWQANVDVQYIGDNSYVVSKYITSYMTKPEKNATAEIWENLTKLHSNKSIASRLRSYGLQRLKDREAGSYEVAHLLLGQHLFGTSTHVKYINVSFKKDRKRRLRPKQELDDLNGDSQELYSNNIIDNYYPNRPDELEDTSLHDICANYDYHKQKPSEKARTNFYQLKKDLGFLKERLQPADVVPKQMINKRDIFMVYCCC